MCMKVWFILKEKNAQNVYNNSTYTKINIQNETQRITSMDSTFNIIAGKIVMIYLSCLQCLILITRSIHLLKLDSCQLSGYLFITLKFIEYMVLSLPHLFRKNYVKKIT